MPWFKLLINCIVRKQAQTVYKAGKQIIIIVELDKTEKHEYTDTAIHIAIHGEYHDILIIYQYISHITSSPAIQN